MLDKNATEIGQSNACTGRSIEAKTENNNVFSKIIHHYYQLTAAEKKVANFVISQQLNTQFMSISELAAASEVAEATVSRFCRQIGYKSYNAFKLAIANAGSLPSRPYPLADEIFPKDDLELIGNKLLKVNETALQQTLNLIDFNAVTAAADILCRSEKILCMGQGGSMIMAQEAAHLFTTALPGYFAIADSHLQAIVATQLTAKDAVLYFSYSGATRDLLEVQPIVHKSAAKFILVTRFPCSPGGKAADVVLQCGSNENPLQLGSIAARIAQLFVLDILFTEVCRRDEESCRVHRKNIADALADKHA